MEKQKKEKRPKKSIKKLARPHDFSGTSDTLAELPIQQQQQTNNVAKMFSHVFISKKKVEITVTTSSIECNLLSGESATSLTGVAI